MSAFFQNILEWIFGWIGNYGWAVVVFTVLVRVVLLPLDLKSKKNMRAMTKVQPKVQALQKKYANDKEKLNMKLNELYKKEKVSPMAGCLPMLLSMVVLWFMFAAMRNLANEKTIEMILHIKETGEVPVLQSWLWIRNVFQPDSFGVSMLPAVEDGLKSISAVSGSSILTEANIAAAREFLATPEYLKIALEYGCESFKQLPINLLVTTVNLSFPASWSVFTQYANGWFLLPIMAAVSQFLMTALMSGKQAQTPAGAPGQEQQMANNPLNGGFMKWFFPLFSLFLCAGYNSAFAIYWMAANVVQIVQQFFVNLYFERKDRLEAAKETEAEMIK